MELTVIPIPDMLPRRDVPAPTGLHARIAVVQISMTMPVMEPDLDAAALRNWAGAIDDGPFASLCWGEHIAFDNPETLTLMGALAVWTDRVRLVTTVIVPQLHDPVMLAKANVALAVTRPNRRPSHDHHRPHR
jgi:alkanesulfonate monooxygenase SsuD/methylene tetrahydromethanopterin reductase-like flavin-dependent oxidoreductase (luciferase family)